MSNLDKWIKPKKKVEKPKKNSQKDYSKEIKKEIKSTKPIEKFAKYNLTCSKKGCGYKKTIVKKELNEQDKKCPRCKSEMKIKNI
ncbi:MAG TPA: hypothetical protein VGB37_17510 [Candidatus Lokiarchaeia archaeon]